MKKSRILVMVMTVALVMAIMVVPAFAEGTTAITSSDFQSVIDGISAQISVTSIVGVLGTVVASSIGLVFMWWGVRKVSRAVMGAFRKGKLSV